MHQPLTDYGPHIGYFLLFMGALLEGETVVLTAGYFAFKGYLSLPAVMGIAFCGTLVADQVLFFIGHRWGYQLLKRHPKLEAKSKRVFKLLRRYQSFYIFAFRFIYGIRVASPLIIGTAGIKIKDFIILDILAAALWSTLAAVIGYFIGYFFAGPIELFISKLINFEKITALILVIILLCLGGLYAFYRRKS